jgi:NAD(P) transhydrogenase subunit alpha
VRIAVLKETAPGETRVALTPDVAARLLRQGHEIVVEAGAGAAAGFPDATYEKAGATVAQGAEATTAGADLAARIQLTTPADVQAAPSGCVLVGLLWPASNPDIVRAAQAQGVTLFAMDLVPRITRAQSMDALSSMSTIAGYRAGLLAAQHLDTFLPMLMTAAGTIPPARIVVLGAGVAGLQAIATCRRLGAVVEAYDVRAEAREQARSLGAETIEVELAGGGEGEGGYARELTDTEKEKVATEVAKRVAAADAVITTALIPGRPAPRLIEAETVAKMRPGAVIVDLAAETGGNCALTEPGVVSVHHGVKIVGLLNLPASLPRDASRMYAKNIEEVARHLTPKPPAEGEAGSEASLVLDFEDEITAGAVAVHAGEVRHAPTKALLEGESS